MNPYLPYHWERVGGLNHTFWTLIASQDIGWLEHCQALGEAAQEWSVRVGEDDGA